MKKLITIASLRAVLGFWFIVALFAFGNIPAVKAEETPTVEGEWVITSTNVFAFKAGDRYVVVRQGDGYSTRHRPQSLLPASAYQHVLYYGTPTQIMGTAVLSYDDLVDMSAGAGLSDSDLRKWADKITIRYQFTLSEDGRSAEHAMRVS